MKVSVLILLFVTSLSFQAQNKEDIINELKNIFKTHCGSDDFKNSDIFYNSEEKILDMGKCMFDLNITKLTYESIPGNKGLVHVLSFTCIHTTDCIKSDASDASSVGAFFDDKKFVYEAMDAIYKLKKID